MRLWEYGIRTAAFGVGLLAVSPLLATDGWAARSTGPAAHSGTAKPATKIVASRIGSGGLMKNASSKATIGKGPMLKSEMRAASISAATGSVGRKGMISHAYARYATHGFYGGSKLALLKGGKARYATYGGSYGGGLQCVPFARAATGIELKGNAANWWDAATGVYARGQAPEAGSVLNFRATGGMRLGHVAVVTHVVDSREIEIDHANWAGPGASKGGVSRAIPVVDVSDNNDWSAVRVGLGHSGTYGSVYPTFGFIYDRPDNGMMARRAVRYDEVAEAPARAIR